MKIWRDAYVKTIARATINRKQMKSGRISCPEYAGRREQMKKTKTEMTWENWRRAMKEKPMEKWLTVVTSRRLRQTKLMWNGQEKQWEGEWNWPGLWRKMAGEDWADIYGKILKQWDRGLGWAVWAGMACVKNENNMKTIFMNDNEWHVSVRNQNVTWRLTILSVKKADRKKTDGPARLLLRRSMKKAEIIWKEKTYWNDNARRVKVCKQWGNDSVCVNDIRLNRARQAREWAEKIDRQKKWQEEGKKKQMKKILYVKKT